jgi:hypothetical protein
MRSQFGKRIWQGVDLRIQRTMFPNFGLCYSFALRHSSFVIPVPSFVISSPPFDFGL